MFVGSIPALGVLLAILSAAVLSVGNLWQSRGVERATARTSGAASAIALIKTPVWLAGSAMFGVAIILQMAALTFAPLILVQPIGVMSLVFAALLTARATGKRPEKPVMVAILLSLVGVTGYVIVAAIVSTQKPITDGQLIAVLATLGTVLLVSLLLRLASRGAPRAPLMYVLLGAIYSAFVATLGKTVIVRVEQLFKHGHHFSFDSGTWLTLACLVGIGVASAFSIYYVQSSHTNNPPDVVMGGLSVIDPAVAVALGIIILHEAAGAPVWSYFSFAIAGGVAIIGVVLLARAETGSGGTDDDRKRAAPDEQAP